MTRGNTVVAAAAVRMVISRIGTLIYILCTNTIDSYIQIADEVTSK